LARQAAVLEAGGQVVQETRGWHDGRRETFSQRVKEEAEDYRYFAEPDLPPLFIDEAWIGRIRAALPEQPQARERRYQDTLGLSAYDAAILAEDQAVAEWFDAAVAVGGEPKTVANWLINDIFKLLNERGARIETSKLAPEGLIELLGLVEGKTINAGSAKEVLAAMVESGEQATAIVAARGLGQISNEAALGEMLDAVIAANPAQVEAYLAGKEGLRGFFVGQVMRQTRGQADPERVNRLFDQRMSAARAAAK
jgi:aspartyl-tRNA(Asn)/glutamyl-tRNA(Gln) amidotransferase subunit B